MEKKIKHFTEITSFEIAREVTGRPDVPAFTDVPEDMREWFQSLYRAAIETEAINGDCKVEPTNIGQWKYLPWLVVDKKAPSFKVNHSARQKRTHN